MNLSAPVQHILYGGYIDQCGKVIGEDAGAMRFIAVVISGKYAGGTGKDQMICVRFNCCLEYIAFIVVLAE